MTWPPFLNMAAPKGNEYYKLRSKNGRDRIFETPEDLVKSCNEYFEWVLENPFEEENLFNYQGNITKENAKKMRPMTLKGLCNFLDITLITFNAYEKKEDFVWVTRKVKQIIENHMFEGATAGFFNQNIIARQLGLSENVSVHTEQPLFPPLNNKDE